MCLADLAWEDGSDVVASPRQMLRRQLARLAERGWSANASTELEFLVFRDTYEDAWRKGYRELEPGQPLQRRLLAAGHGAGRAADPPDPQLDGRAGMVVENSKGECNFGQHEINFRYADALRPPTSTRSTRTAPRRSPPRRGWRSASWPSTTSAREARATSTSRSPTTDGMLFPRDRRCSTSFLAGQLACLRELTLLQAPNVNSYKRYADGSFAPTAIAWAHDNRTCALRVVGHGPALRFENRAGGSDLNPYMALSAMIAAGLHGVEAGARARARLRGQRLPGDRQAAAAEDAARGPRPVRRSSVARAAFGEEVVDHYVNAADVELAAFESAVTDWERIRGFERL